MDEGGGSGDDKESTFANLRRKNHPLSKESVTLGFSISDDLLRSHNRSKHAALHDPTLARVFDQTCFRIQEVPVALNGNRLPEAAKRRPNNPRNGSLGEQVLSHAQAGREVVQDFVPLARALMGIGRGIPTAAREQGVSFGCFAGAVHRE